MTTHGGWGISLLGGLSAHFFQEDGSSKPGTDFAVSLNNGSGEKRILVRIYDDNCARGSKQQAEAVVGYVATLLQSGWTPDQYKEEPGELVVPKDVCPDPSIIRQKPW